MGTNLKCRPTRWISLTNWLALVNNSPDCTAPRLWELRTPTSSQRSARKSPSEADGLMRSTDSSLRESFYLKKIGAKLNTTLGLEIALKSVATPKSSTWGLRSKFSNSRMERPSKQTPSWVKSLMSKSRPSTSCKAPMPWRTQATTWSMRSHKPIWSAQMG